MSLLATPAISLLRAFAVTAMQASRAKLATCSVIFFVIVELLATHQPQRQLRHRRYAIVPPPSTTIVCPVMYPEAGEARNTATPFNSPSPPTRPIGTAASI